MVSKLAPAARPGKPLVEVSEHERRDIVVRKKLEKHLDLKATLRWSEPEVGDDDANWGTQLEAHLEGTPRLTASDAQVVPSHVEDRGSREERVAVVGGTAFQSRSRHGSAIRLSRQKVELMRVGSRLALRFDLLEADNVEG